MSGHKPYCDGCKKKPTIHLTEIINGKVTEMHLCDDCPLLKTIQMEKQFGLSDLIAGLADFEKIVTPEEKVQFKCENCGLTYEDFRKFGRLGCSVCYDQFRAQLSALLKKIHGSNQHFGKAPVKLAKPVADKKNQLQRLKEELSQAVQDEDFEKAAILRDKIREAERKEDVDK